MNYALLKFLEVRKMNVFAIYLFVTKLLTYFYQLQNFNFKFGNKTKDTLGLACS